MGKHASPGRGRHSTEWIAYKWDKIRHIDPQRPGGPKRSGPHNPPNHGSGFDLSKHFAKKGGK
jgi:hypothetical protein